MDPEGVVLLGYRAGIGYRSGMGIGDNYRDSTYIWDQCVFRSSDYPTFYRINPHILTFLSTLP
jgi:hypothetical protein